jgi:hypothetical protein
MLSQAIGEYWHILLLAASMVGWRIWGHHFRTWTKRHEQRRHHAELQAMYDRANPNSHFRQSVEQINEDTPAVAQLTESPGTFVWAGSRFPTRAEAEAARWHHVLSEARSFYKDLDRELGNRLAGRRSSDTINGEQR